MRPTVQIPDICEFLTRHLMDVFETMLGMNAVSSASDAPLAFEERVTGCVAFAGEHINGAVYLHLGAPFAAAMAAAMMSQAIEKLGEAEVNDVVGEITNMLAGGLKSWLCDSDAECAVSTPAIIRGSAFIIEPSPGVERKRLVFHCDHNAIVVEIHVKMS